MPLHKGRKHLRGIRGPALVAEPVLPGRGGDQARPSSCCQIPDHSLPLPRTRWSQPAGIGGLHFPLYLLSFLLWPCITFTIKKKKLFFKKRKSLSGEENPEGGKSGRPPPQGLRATFGSQTRLPSGLQDCLAHTSSPHTPAPSRVHTRPRGKTRPGVRPAPPGSPRPYLVGPFNPFHVREVNLGNRRPKRKLRLETCRRPRTRQAPTPKHRSFAETHPGYPEPTLQEGNQPGGAHPPWTT